MPQPYDRRTAEHLSSDDAPLSWKHAVIAAASLAAILLHVVLRVGVHADAWLSQLPLLATLVVGGAPLIVDLLKRLLHREFGADLLAGMSILTAVFLHEYLAGSIIVLMLAGGEALETYAVRHASSALHALAKRLPSLAHRRQDAMLVDVALEDVAVGDTLVILPHEICPVDGVVIEGHGVMDESFLTGEPFQMSKAPGSGVLSGAVNGDSALTIRAEALARDSRYAKITQIMRAAQHARPRLRRLGDRLGALYTPIALTLAVFAWAVSHDPVRFLAVLVIATPCPLIIAIPVAIIGSISLCARRAIIVKNPVVLEQIDMCQTVIFDKTGTLTYGEPRLSEQLCAPGVSSEEVLGLAASLEQYSKHPLAKAILASAKQAGVALREATQVSEKPGEGLRGTVSGRQVQITSRRQLTVQPIAGSEHLPPEAPGLECVVVVDQRYAATCRFGDEPRAEGLSFIRHLGARHQVHRILVVSGDQEAAVRRLAQQIGITEVYAQQSPEQKLEIVQRETRAAPTLFVGDGLNDAPALMAATVGVAVGQHSDITSEAAGVVVMDSSLTKVDEFLHISRRMRAIALQSAVGGMVLSLVGMGMAAAGSLNPVAGAMSQEVIDLLAVLNALRAAMPPHTLSDFV